MSRAVYVVEERIAMGKAVYSVEARSAISRAVCYDDPSIVSMAVMLTKLNMLSILQYGLFATLIQKTLIRRCKYISERSMARITWNSSAI